MRVARGPSRNPAPLPSHLWRAARRRLHRGPAAAGLPGPAPRGHTPALGRRAVVARLHNLPGGRQSAPRALPGQKTRVGPRHRPRRPQPRTRAPGLGRLPRRVGRGRRPQPGPALPAGTTKGCSSNANAGTSYGCTPWRHWPRPSRPRAAICPRCRNRPPPPPSTRFARPPHRIAVEVHLAEGNVACAVKRYEDYRRLLRRREWKVGPSPRMTRLVRDLTRT